MPTTVRFFREDCGAVVGVAFCGHAVADDKVKRGEDELSGVRSCAAVSALSCFLESLAERALSSYQLTVRRKDSPARVLMWGYYDCAMDDACIAAICTLKAVPNVVVEEVPYVGRKEDIHEWGIG